MKPETRNSKLAAIILAAGKGTRMKSSLAKVLHPLHGAPMLSYSVNVARKVGASDIVAVVGHQAELIEETLKGEGLVFVRQEAQLGTGHAVHQTRDLFRDFEGTILILCGDVPLLRPSTVEHLMEKHSAGQADVTVLTTRLDDPSGYGRIVKGEGDRILKIVEERDATAEEKGIREINTGIYCAECPFLFEAVAAIDNRNAQREYYLTDIVGIANRRNRTVRAFAVPDFQEVMGINTREDLKRAEDVIRRRGSGS